MMMDAEIPKRTFALLIGIERYDAGSRWNLDGPAYDARRMASWLLQKGVPPSQILLHLSPGDEKLMDGEPRARPASRKEVRKALLENLYGKQGDFLLIFWGGHGVIDLKGNRRLFYPDATTIDKQSLDLDDLFLALKTTHFKGFPRQICIVDACANFVEHMRWAQSLPGDELAKGLERRYPEPEQFVLLAARPGEAAANRSSENTGQFSKILLEVLAGQPWPLDIDPLVEELKKRFKSLRTNQESSQTPIYWWAKGREDDSKPEFDPLDLLAASLESTTSFGWASRNEVERIAGPLISEATLKKLYMQSLPWHGLFNDQATSMRHVLIELADLSRQEGDGSSFPLLEFVERLTLHIREEFPTEALQLQRWSNLVGPQADVTAEELHDLRSRLSKRAEADGDPFHLLVHVIPDRLDQKRFSVAAYSWRRVQEFERIELLPEDFGTLLVSDIESLLIRFMEETLPNLLPADAPDVVLEFFLPRELLCWSVDQLHLRAGTNPTPVGIHYRVIVRWQDRALKNNWDFHWKRKWQRAKTKTSILPDCIFWILANEDYRAKELQAKLFSSPDNFCLGLGFSPPEIPAAEDLLSAIIDSGIPVALWLRKPWTDPDHIYQEISRICKGKHVADLPEVVRKIRLEAYGSENGAHIGHHLTLLWDNAERRLPGSNQPLTLPRG